MCGYNYSYCKHLWLDKYNIMLYTHGMKRRTGHALSERLLTVERRLTALEHPSTGAIGEPPFEMAAPTWLPTRMSSEDVNRPFFDWYEAFIVENPMGGPTLFAAWAAGVEASAKIVDDYLSAYPVAVFSEPPAGQHGVTVDACSAAAIRAILPNIAEDIRKLGE